MSWLDDVLREDREDARNDLLDEANEAFPPQDEDDEDDWELDEHRSI